MDKIISYLTSKGFNNKQIDKILNNYVIRQYKDYDLLLNRIQTSIQWLESLKYGPKDIVHICFEIPNVLCISKDILQSKIDCFVKNGFNEKQIFKIIRNCPHALSYSVDENIQPLFNFIKSLGISDVEFKRIFLRDPKLLSVSTDELKKRIVRNEGLKIDKALSKKILIKAPSAYNSEKTIPNRLKAIREAGITYPDKSFKKLGFTEEEVLKIISRFPVALTYAPSSLNKKITNLANLGFSDKEIKKMLLAAPPILSHGEKAIKSHIDHFRDLGYSEKQLTKVFSNMATIFNIGIKTIDKKFANMEKQGFSKSTFIDMTVSHSSLLNLTPTLMNKKLKSLRKLGFTQEELVSITTASPNLITSSIEMTREKIEYLRKIGLGAIITKTPTNLITSLATIYARYEFFKNRIPPVRIDDEHYANLFITWRNFEKKYGITKEELLRDYNYEEYKNRRGGELDDEDDKDF